METSVPIIFVPGVLSSQLYLPGNGKKVWFSAANFLKYAPQLDIGYEVSVRNNEVNQQTLPLLMREYGVMAQEIVLIERLCSTFAGRPVYFFSYDFRRSCVDSARALHEEIEFVCAKEGVVRVAVVCHSMGGLVTAAYVHAFGSARLQRVCAMGVPFEGSPEILQMVLTGNIVSVPNYVAGPIGLKKEMLASFPGLADMMPSMRYLSSHPLRRGGISLGPAEMERILQAAVPENYASAREFQGAVNAGGRNILMNLSCSYFAVGVGKKTLVSLELENTGAARRIENESGDGSVPYDSAVMGGTLDSLPVDAAGRPRVTRFFCHHSDLLRFREPLDWLMECLALE